MALEGYPSRLPSKEAGLVCLFDLLWMKRYFFESCCLDPA
jgi:hypothetical protein